MKPKRAATKRRRVVRKPGGGNAGPVVVTRWRVAKGRIEAEVAAQASRRGFAGTVSLHPGKLDFHHGGADDVVSQSDLEKYAASIIEKGLALSASRGKERIDITLTARTVAILTGTKGRRLAKPKGERVAGTGERSFAMPEPDKIVKAVLAMTKGKGSRRSVVRTAVAKSLSVPPDKLKLRVRRPDGSEERSFAETFELIVGHLQKFGALKTDGKKIVALPNNKPVPPYEPPAKSAKARAAEPEAARSAGPVDVRRLIMTLPDQDPEKLLRMWKNAVRIIGDESQADRHQEAAVLATEISKEWDRRARMLTDDAYFRWPTTDAPGGGRGQQYRNLRQEGMLKYLEYKVGKESEPSPYRHALLSRVFENSLPPVFDRPYMAEWGPNASSTRLHKMAHCLASFARNFKYQDNDKYDEAIRHWEQDLEFLHDRYYVGRFGFGWPATAV